MQLPALLLSLALSCLSFVAAQQGTTCSAANPCTVGCCSKYGNCGFGPDFCGDGCQANCNAKAECGQYGITTLCPLNVCCSQYGFCGTTDSFCGTGCQNGCAPVNRPSCTPTTDSKQWERKIAYYELFGAQRPCDFMEPANIPAGAFTHINLAFQVINPDFTITDTNGDLVAKISRLKATYTGLRVNIAIGGWAFNDSPTENIFSNMASTAANRNTFIVSLIRYILKYGLDGVDMDWEYPVALDRGGSPADYDNYPALLQEMRAAFDAVNPAWQITATLPSSYWYMRGFNLQALQKHVNWFNFMSYDLHGMWDQYNQFTGPYLLGHTNITEIDQGLDLLWRNRVSPENVVMGMAFYGRSFTMTDNTCYKPGCTFSSAGIAGTCSETPGIRIYAEVVSASQSINAMTYYDPVSTVKYMVYDSSQWISYDDAQSFADKRNFLSSRCLSGAMVWAIDQDDAMLDATAALLGEDVSQSLLLHTGNLTPEEMEDLADALAAYNGENCYATVLCTDDSASQKTALQQCAVDYTSVAISHAPYQGFKAPLFAELFDFFATLPCVHGTHRHICCPTAALPKNCQWNDAATTKPNDCGRTCSSTQFQLNIDRFKDPQGNAMCMGGQRHLCCDSTELLDECQWTDRQILTSSNPLPSCPTGQKYMTLRYDDDDGQTCSQKAGLSPGDTSRARAFCCPNNDVPANCGWTNSGTSVPAGGVAQYDPPQYCHPTACPSTQVQYTSALDPPASDAIYSGIVNVGNAINCQQYPPAPNSDPYYKYCCDPPNEYSEKWPVAPSYLWQNYYDDSGAAVLWAYADNYANNNADSKNDDNDYGSDAYGFVMLDGPDGSLASNFKRDFIVARSFDDRHLPSRRSIITSNSSHIGSAFEHAEETVYVYCKHAVHEPACWQIFKEGAEDTIITLPDHIGEGPFARVVSFEEVHESSLASHHLAARSAAGSRTPVFKLKFDYDFHLIKPRASGNVNMRVDYTNLLSYWDAVTDTPARKAKRSVEADHLSYHDFRGHVRRAKDEHYKRHKRTDKTRSNSIVRSMAQAMPHVPTKLGKRWFGAFAAWLSRLNNIENSAVGTLNMIWNKSVLLYHAALGCPTSTASAELSVYLDSNVALQSTYAYYFSGTIVPPAITGTYAYFGLDPQAYLGVRIEGYAALQYRSARVKLIDTLSYPGLAIKGLAAVGPTLDVFGQITGSVVISGQMQAGLRFNFEKQEWYWPNDADSAKYQELLGLEADPEPVMAGIQPEFSATVDASADLNILVTPEAHLGITIGGSGLLPTTLVDANIVGYINSTLNFHAEAHASTSSVGGTSTSYSYGIYFLYNIGYGAVAKIPLFPWYATLKDLYNPLRVVPLYTSSSISSSNAKRSVPDMDHVKFPRRGILNRHQHDTIQPPFGDHKHHFSNQSVVSSTDLPLRRRQSPAQTDAGSVADINSLWQLFSCPEQKGCPCNCAAGNINKRDVIPEFVPNATLTKRQGGGTGGTGPGTGTGAGTCATTLPDFRINCGVFGDAQANGPNGGTVVVGICNNQQIFFNAIGAASTGNVYTYDADPTRKNGRRFFVCGGKNGKFCNAANNVLALATGVNSGAAGVQGFVSCDEFPFASSEEGGNYYGTLPGVTTASAARCVPVYQQTLQGICNALPGTLSTNVNYPDKQTSVAAQWVAWSAGSGSWTPSLGGGVASSGFQRMARYPSYQFNPSQIPAGNTPDQGGPGSGGIASPDWNAANQRLGYYIKRNYTYGLTTPGSPSDGASWSPTGAQGAMTRWTLAESGTTSTDATQIVCAINIFGQGDVYQYGNYNGYCITGTNNNPIFGAFVTMKACKIAYTGSPAPVKRSVGSWNGWEIESIEIVEDAPSFEVPAEFTERLGPSIPFNWTPGSDEYGEDKRAATGPRVVNVES